MKKIVTTITVLMLTVLCVHAQEDAAGRGASRDRREGKAGRRI